jgi:hypothetical protein
MLWAGIISNEVVGPFRVEQGVKINSENYCKLLGNTLFKQWYKKKAAAFKKKMIFMRTMLRPQYIAKICLHVLFGPFETFSTSSFFRGGRFCVFSL